jgi:hypothetical protein
MNAESKPKFLDSLTGLFRAKAGEAAPTPPIAADDFVALGKNFDAALHDLDERAEEYRRRRAAACSVPGVGRSMVKERAAERERSIAEIRHTIRKEIGSMHEKLGTGVGADLEALSAFLEEVAVEVEAGKESHELIPRTHARAVQRLQKEAGELALARLDVLLRRQNLDWPDPTHHETGVRPEEVERSRRRNLAEVRESFLGQSLSRTAERLLGIVTVWGSDYPRRGSAIWKETVLESIAAGIRGHLVREFIVMARRDEDHLVALAKVSIGKELIALQQVLKTGVASIEQANQAAASALRVLDEAVPDLVWEHIHSKLPRARGEWDV